MKTIRKAFENSPGRMVLITVIMLIVLAMLVTMWVIPFQMVSTTLAVILTVANVLITLAVLGFNLWVFRTMASD